MERVFDKNGKNASNPFSVASEPLPKKVPQETSKNRISVGGVGVDYSYSVYNPHNSRFYFDFDSSSWNPPLGGSVFRRVNSSEFVLDSWKGCRWVVKKRMIEVTNKIDKERRFIIKGSVDERRQLVVDAIAVLESEVLVRLHEFVAVFGGRSSFLPARAPVVWDNKILHDRIVDSVPQSVIFRNDVVKKVYSSLPSCVEVSSPEGASTMFRNLALLDVVPELASELGEIKAKQVGFEVLLGRFASEALVPLTEQIRLHLAVQDKTLSVLSLIERKLGESHGKRLLEDWGW